MISDSTVENLYTAITIYNLRVDQDFLIALYKGKNESRFIKIRIKKENFWHLIGCKIKESCQDKDGVYEKCLHREHIKDDLNYSNGSSSNISKKKFNVFINIFDFVLKAKELKVYDTNSTPDSNMFVFGIGKQSGLVGYDKDDKKDFLYPKTVQDKTFNINYKILFILAKKSDNDKYHVEYKAGKGIDIPHLIPENIKLDARN